MDVWVDRHMDGGQVGAWADGGRVVGEVGAWMEGGMGGWLGGWVGSWADGRWVHGWWMDGQMCGCVGGWQSESASIWNVRKQHQHQIPLPRVLYRTHHLSSIHVQIISN